MNVKEMTTLRQNAVVTLQKGHETYKLYLNVGAVLEAHCKRYIDEGWTVFSTELCTKEAYLNYRVNDVVESINEINSERDKLKAEFKLRKLTLDDYTTALTVTHELEMCDLRKLYRLMNRISREGYDCYNEEAIQLYNLWFV